MVMSPMAFTVTAAGSSCRAARDGTKAKRAASTYGAVFQLRSCRVYCGAPLTDLVVTT